jgi:thioredoxin-related protein
MLDNNEVMTDRLFIGKSRDDDKSLVSLSDIKGTPRLVLSVEPNGNPKINFLDETGKVIYSLPENAASKK